MINLNDEITSDAEGENPAPNDPGPAGISVVHQVFRNRFGQWRAIWRILLYLIGAGAFILLFGFLAGAVARSRPGAGFISWTGSLTWVAGNLALIVAAYLVLRFFDHRPFAMLGLDFSRNWLRELGIGVAAGLGTTGFLVMILVVTGAVKLEISASPAASFSALPLLIWIFTVAGLLEELMFRGYLMQALSEGTRWWIGGVTTSLVFTWAHVDNPDVTVFGISNIFLAGVILAVLYFLSRRLWLPVGFHISWNLAQSWLWGFDVSGIKISDQLLVMTPTGPELLTGGEFGLEGSALFTVLFVVLIAWLVWKKPFRPTEAVAAMWSPYPTGLGLGRETESEPDREAQAPVIDALQSIE